MRSPEQIIKRPLLTEKGTRLKDTGGRGEGDIEPESLKSQLLFEVASDANKVEIRAAVQKLWNVDVVAVRTAIVRGGGHKRRFRLIDFRRNKLGVPATVATVEYDPNRTARIALLHYADGEKRYILCPDGLKVGDKVLSSRNADIKPGNNMPLRFI